MDPSVMQAATLSDVVESSISSTGTQTAALVVDQGPLVESCRQQGSGGERVLGASRSGTYGCCAGREVEKGSALLCLSPMLPPADR
jgi:hypothetical protein